MGKKRKYPDIEDVLGRPWCYYCERDFEDLKLLISHQKAKHFKCEACGRRLNTAGGLSVHMNQVHKETLSQVENALPNRQGLDVEIFGMEGIPQDILEQHKNRIIQNFYQAQEERRIVTGNPVPGGSGPPRKKIRYESMEELKKRFHEWREQKKLGTPTEGSAVPAATGNYPPQQFAGGQPAYQDGQFGQPGFQPPQGAGAAGYPAAAAGGGISATSLPPRPGSGAAPAPTGLPQRPSYWDGSGGAEEQQGVPGAGGAPPRPQGDDIDQLIRMAEAGIKPSRDGEEAAAAAAAAAQPEKKSKKDKQKMVYFDGEISPEERMVQMVQYRFEG